ncbi:uncharacterized protein C2845_PM18G05220 [Panicum miliaceum]|uniref:Retrotransposon gag domain-containing protein n=1 Tax=Panicum miliaceum TaxID=4540 RepID=A0A3L6PJH6_PANMI|nr:uncharacterized protein C2845_PM18G05220 [Panicum miliaceum]
MQLLPSALLCRSSKLHRGEGGGKEGSPQAAAVTAGRGLMKEEEVEGMLWACGKEVATGAEKFPKNAHWKDKITSNTMRRESRPELLRKEEAVETCVLSKGQRPSRNREPTPKAPSGTHAVVVRPRERTVHIEDGPNEDSEEEYRRRREHHQRSRRSEEPWKPLAIELEQVPWPPHFNAVILPQYDGESDPREFLLKYEVVVESNRGESTIKAKAFVMAVKGSAQHWYASILKGHIYSWSQLRSKLLTSFRGLKMEELTSCDFHNCKQGEKATLQEYMQCIIKMRAKAPNRPLRRIPRHMQAAHCGRTF